MGLFEPQRQHKVYSVLTVLGARRCNKFVVLNFSAFGICKEERDEDRFHRGAKVERNEENYLPNKEFHNLSPSADIRVKSTRTNSVWLAWERQFRWIV
jgi:hypothetical protein